jgi:outer membrane lipoprotein-sorting protein
MRYRWMICLVVGLAISAAHAADGGTLPADQVLMQSRAKYAALTSYSDSGSVTTSYRSGPGPADVDRYTFRTLYHTPRQFYLEFKKDPKVSDERFVIWSEGQNFNSWWSATKVHEDYPQGQGATAFALGALPTQGADVMIPPLLFAKAGLQGPLANFVLTKSEGTDKVANHLCYRLLGQEALAYKTGTVTGSRAVTVWIDAESMLVRRVFEDTPPGDGADIIQTITTTIDPSADPTIDPTRFHFEVPKN